jgi:hypothetical protein
MSDACPSLPTNLPTYLPTYLPIYLPTCLPTYLPNNTCLSPSLHPEGRRNCCVVATANDSGANVFGMLEVGSSGKGVAMVLFD